MSFAIVLALGGCGDQGEAVYAFTEITAEEHEAIFPIAAGAHAIGECNDCHGSFDTFSEFACIDGCHLPPGHPRVLTDSQHPDVAGYLYTSDACLACHPDGENAQ